MRILITNDDGIRAPILPVFAQKIAAFAEVTVVAPKSEQSGKSQAIDFHNVIEIKQVDLLPGVTAYSVDSTPADCVRFGITGLGQTYDLILSGINCGYNLGDDIVYSGTVGAIFEGARLGVRGIAISSDPDTLPTAPDALDTLFAFIKQKELFSFGTLFNVNIPPQFNGISLTRQGGMFYTDEFESRGKDLYIQVGSPVPQHTADPNIDIDAIAQNLISITPLTMSRTDFTVLEKLKKL